MNPYTFNKFSSICLLLTVFSLPLSAQSTKIYDNARHRFGFSLSSGHQNLGQFLETLNEPKSNEWKTYFLDRNIDPAKTGLSVTYDYRVTLFQLQHYIALIRRETWGVDIVSQPQFNVMTYRPVDELPETARGFEFGLNTGLLIRKNFFNDFLSLYLLGSTGPHYVSGTPARQAKGFIFSDAFLIGGNIRLYKDFYLDLNGGIRHISNIGFIKPNGGVNTLHLSVGIMYNLSTMSE